MVVDVIDAGVRVPEDPTHVRERDVRVEPLHGGVLHLRVRRVDGRVAAPHHYAARVVPIHCLAARSDDVICPGAARPVDRSLIFLP